MWALYVLFIFLRRILARFKIVWFVLCLFLVFIAVFKKVLFRNFGQNGEQIDHLPAAPLCFDIFFDPFVPLF